MGRAFQKPFRCWRFSLFSLSAFIAAVCFSEPTDSSLIRTAARLSSTKGGTPADDEVVLSEVPASVSVDVGIKPHSNDASQVEPDPSTEAQPSIQENDSEYMEEGDSSSAGEALDGSSTVQARTAEVDQTRKAVEPPTSDVGTAPLSSETNDKLSPRSSDVSAKFAVETHLVQNPEVEQKKDTPKAHDLRPITADAINKKLKEIGAPFSLGSEHFTVEFRGGLTLDASSVGSRASSSEEPYVWGPVSRRPQYLSNKDAFLTIDLDEPYIGTDVKLVHFFVKPQACENETHGACDTQWLLREPFMASPPHRILILGLSSPKGAKFVLGDLLKHIQQNPFDTDLRRITLSRFFNDHSEFFSDQDGNLRLSPSWNVFRVSGAPSGTDASGEQYQVDHPLIELPPNATDSEKRRAFKLARAAGEELDSVSVPTHGGESPGSSSSISTATIFKYVMGSLLLVGLVVGVLLTVCKCSRVQK